MTTLTRIIDGYDHPQVDTGLGFTCDEQILDTVLAINKVPGIRTQTSCQAYSDTWLVPKAQILFEGDNNRRVFEVCEMFLGLIPIKTRTANDGVPLLKMNFDAFWMGNSTNHWEFKRWVRGRIRFTLDQQPEVIRIFDEIAHEY